MFRYLGLIAVIPGIIYFTFFINRFLRKILNVHTNFIIIFTIGLLVTIISFPAINIIDLYGTIYYHFLVIMLVLEVMNLGFKRFLAYRFLFTSGILGILITAMFLGYGCYNIKHVVATDYQLTSDKLDDFKIVEIADLHMGTSMNVSELKQHCQQISAENPDLVVLTGDIFDENTTYDEMIGASKILSQINNRLGIYFVYGNHEQADYPGTIFTPQQIENILESDGIVVLDDEAVVLDEINIIGRSDASFYGTSDRATTAELLAQIPADKKDNYTLLLDHQPLDLNENASLGIDLQLSGHTHGGQLFPMRFFQTLISDTLVYGRRDIGNFTAITTSGIGGWRYPIKTGARSEYVVVEIDKT